MRGGTERKTKERSEKDQLILIFLCWLVYTVAYIGRYSYSASIIPIENRFGISHTQSGLVSTLFFVSYGAGQIVNGVFCKNYPKRAVLAGALVLSAAVNFTLWCGVGFAAYKYLWLVNGCAQSILYSSLMLVISDFVLQKNHKKAVLAMGTTVGAGTFLAYGASSLLIWAGAYRYIFLIAAVLTAAIALVWFLFYPRVTKRLEAVREENLSAAQFNKDSAGNGVLGGVAFTVAVFCVFAVINNLIKDGLLTWVPSVMIESFALPGGISVLLTLVLPAVGILGTLLMLWLNRICKDNYPLSAGILFAGTALLCFAVTLFMKKQSLWIDAIVCLGMVNCFMMGINNLITAVVPLSLRGRASAGLLSGLFDGFCYAGSAVSAYGIGAVADVTGWTAVFYLFAAAACVPVLYAAVAVPVTAFKRRKSGRNSP